MQDLHDLRMANDALKSFKTYVHEYLDGKGVPTNPEGVHGQNGCRIGDRLDWLFENMASKEVPTSVEDSLIVYSSSLTDGKYILLPREDYTPVDPITCKCVACNSGKLSIAMDAYIESDRITVKAQCEECLAETEVYLLGMFTRVQTDQKELDIPASDPRPGQVDRG